MFVVELRLKTGRQAIVVVLFRDDVDALGGERNIHRVTGRAHGEQETAIQHVFLDLLGDGFRDVFDPRLRRGRT